MLLSEITALFNLEIPETEVTIESVSTDTRSINSGDLFVALKGENFDGNEYVERAIEKGAVAAIVDRDVNADIALIKVDDTRLALGQLAAYWRKQLDLKVIGLTGSNGKTTVKEMITCILSEVGKVTSTAGNFNNDIGLPLTLLKMKPEHEFAVIEMGANHAGEIAYLTDLTKPDVAVLNNAAPAHLEGFGSMQGVAEAKGEIFSGLSEDGVAVINQDDKYVDYWLGLCDGYKKINFGLNSEADISADVDAENYDGCFILKTPKGDVEINLNVLGFHNLKNALAASAATLALNVGLNDIKAGLEKFSGVKGRLQVYKAANDALVIDDTYNANPSSMKAAIDVLSTQKKRTVLVLGDMGELGGDAQSLHGDVGRYAKEKNINTVMTFGALAKHAAKSFGENGFSYSDKDKLIKDVFLQLGNDVAVLVKGSRSMHMEDVVSALTNNNSGAA